MRAYVLDVETTSADPKVGEVIELALLPMQPEPLYGSHTWRWRPEGPMDPRAQAVHGITLEELAGQPRFRESWQYGDLGHWIGAIEVVVGYNVDFDLRMIDAELTRFGAAWDRSRVLVVDAYKLWMAREKRKLADAYRRFVGGDFAGAHGAFADATATARVLDGMVRTFGLHEADSITEYDWAAIADASDPGRALQLGSPHFVWAPDGEVVCNFGKHKGKSLMRLDVGYLQWVLRQDFPPACLEVVQNFLEWEDFYAWAKKKYPPPVTP